MAEPILSQGKPMIPALQTTNILAPVNPAPTAASNEDYLHELRVRIPVDLHRQLLSLKVLRGKSLAETVSTALDIYFAEHSKRANEAEP